MDAALNGGVLGLFPSFGNVGGVERTGRSAWSAIAAASGDGAFAIRYGPEADVAAIRGVVFPVRTQAMAVLRAASRKWPVRLIMVWHIGMLKLLPFVRTDQARIVLFLHGIEAWRPASPAVTKLLKRVDLFLTNSDFTWQRFLEFHPGLRAARHVTVPLGFGAPMMKEIAAPAEAPSVLMIGRIARSEGYKGHDAVIAAWSGVLGRFPEAKLRMAGPCDMRDEIRALATRHGVAGAVEILGLVSEDEKDRYLSECRCMALPSRGEGFGLVYLEAMRAGRPCVVSTLDAGREVVCRDAGLAVDPSNVSELSAALIRLMTSGTEWDAWSAAARERYESRYTEMHFHERLIAALAALS